MTATEKKFLTASIVSNRKREKKRRACVSEGNFVKLVGGEETSPQQQTLLSSRPVSPSSDPHPWRVCCRGGGERKTMSPTTYLFRGIDDRAMDDDSDKAEMAA